MHQQVVIIGGGPSGTLLALILARANIDVLVLEKKTKEYVLSRIRAGVLEWNTVEMLRKNGVGSRMDREGHIHEGTLLSSLNKQFRIDFKNSINKKVMVYGQTEVTFDLYEELKKYNVKILHEIDDIKISDLKEKISCVSFKDVKGKLHSVNTQFVIGCDGFHGISRNHIPSNILKSYEKVYPFGWLGVLSETPPVNDELIYANHSRGFALASMRNENLSRYYIQVPNTDKVEQWSDDNFWDELKFRLPTEASDSIVTGPSIEKSIAPLRSFVSEPMRYGNLYLAGDSTHIVPPTGAKGLNLAVSDIHYLSEGIISFFENNDQHLLETYSEKALLRVWKGIRFSWWMTTLMHNFPNQDEFERKIQLTELDYLSNSKEAQRAFSENYVGLPY
jgi:p-hydroxybenzoate 3-monooxygenase